MYTVPYVPALLSARDGIANLHSQPYLAHPGRSPLPLLPGDLRTQDGFLPRMSLRLDETGGGPSASRRSISLIVRRRPRAGYVKTTTISVDLRHLLPTVLIGGLLLLPPASGMTLPLSAEELSALARAVDTANAAGLLDTPSAEGTCFSHDLLAWSVEVVVLSAICAALIAGASHSRYVQRCARLLSPSARGCASSRAGAAATWRNSGTTTTGTTSSSRLVSRGRPRLRPQSHSLPPSCWPRSCSLWGHALPAGQPAPEIARYVASVM